jgi:uncharacterized DUF497 family protein
MRITWLEDEARRNKLKHGLDFELAAAVFADPLAKTKWNGFVDGEARWLLVVTATSTSRFKILVAGHTYPDPEDDTHVQGISLREATSHERRKYEIRHI